MEKKDLEKYKADRAKLLADMRAINAPEMSEEALASYAKMEADFNKISETIRREEKLLEAELTFSKDKAAPFKQDFDGREVVEGMNRETFGGDKPLTSEQLTRAQAAYLRFGHTEVSDEDMKLAERAGYNLHKPAMVMPLHDTAEYNQLRHKFAQSALQGSLGGYTVPTTLNTGVEVARLNHSQMRQVAGIIRTGGGGPLEWPTIDDTSNSASIAGENAARNTTNVTFGKKTWYAYTLSSDFAKVPMELLQDTAVNLIAVLSDLLGERLARKEAALFTTGTGASEPQGIVTGATLGKTAASATAITINEVFDLQYSVGSYYRTNGAFMAHPSVLLALRKLVDGQGQYLWQPSIVAGVPDMFNGKRVFENENMASSIATTAKTILFGDLATFKIRDVGEIVISRANERFIDNNQIAFIGHSRIDSGVLNAGQNPIKYLQQA